MFRKKHPYLFWQLISWGIVIVGAGTSFIGMLNDAGEWIYPVVVFTFIAGIALVVTTPEVSAIRDADRIIVLQDGYIKETGTHEELLAKKGYYYELIKLQTGLDEL